MKHFEERCIWPFGWSIYCSLKPHQKWSPWKGGCQEVTLKERKQLCRAMPNYARTGLKIRDNRSYEVMNPPQSPNLNIVEAVWDHLNRERNKKQPTSKEELWDVPWEAWRTIPEDYLKKWQKAWESGFRLCWRIKILWCKFLRFLPYTSDEKWNRALWFSAGQQSILFSSAGGQSTPLSELWYPGNSGCRMSSWW